MRSRSRPGLRRSPAIWECPDWGPSGPVFLGKSQTGTGTAGFGLVQTRSQSVQDRTSPTLATTASRRGAILVHAPASGSQLMFAFELHSNMNRTLFEPECHVLFKVLENCHGTDVLVWHSQI